MERTLLLPTLLLSLIALISSCSSADNQVLSSYPAVYTKSVSRSFPLMVDNQCADICLSDGDYAVVNITATMLADDVERVTGNKPAIKKVSTLDELTSASVVAGTVGHSAIIDQLVSNQLISVDAIQGKWEASVVKTIKHPTTGQPLFVIAGSDRRGTAFGLTSLSRAIGVSPWYWWADVAPSHKDALYIQPGLYTQQEPSVQYRGIFINDERFGGWAQWVERHFDKETGKVGPKVYEKIFELLLRLKGNYLWPAMHPGTQALASHSLHSSSPSIHSGSATTVSALSSSHVAPIAVASSSG